MEQTRWTLANLLAACAWLRLGSLPGLCQLLRRLKIHRKAARAYVHSPDPDYVEKLGDIRVQIRRVPEADQGLVLLFADEFTLYRHPSLARAYELAGKVQPLARLGYKGNYTWRIAASLNCWTGQVDYHQAWFMDVTRLLIFYRKLTQAYPEQEIGLVEDNWPVHYHPDLLAALQPQVLPYASHVPPHWSRNPKRQVDHLQWPIRLYFLPTYASWTNPIEKLWRLLKQEVLHLHRYEDDWPGLKQRVFRFLDEFADGSPELLHYVGLRDPGRLYNALFPT